MTKPKTISFISAPGGVGKTTTALCSAWFMKQRNYSNLLIDLDPSLGLSLSLFDFREYKSEIDNNGRTAADLLQHIIEKPNQPYGNIDLFINRKRFLDINLDLICSSMRMEDVMGKIWHTTTAGHAEKKLKKVLALINQAKDHDYYLIDNIPCYGLTYALTTVFASDYLIIPLRTTINDLGRTLGMIKKLQDTAFEYEMDKKKFENMLYFVFNKVTHHNLAKLPKYKTELLKTFPNSHIFENTIPEQVGFTRIGTEEEKSDDKNKVKEKFKPFFIEFEKKILSQ